MFTIQLNGIKELRELYASAAEQLAEEVQKAISGTANAIADAAKQNCSGKLADSITATISDDGMSATVTSASPYAAMVEYGASIPEIEPKNAKVLHWKEDGQDVYAKRASAHENAPKPFLNPAFEEQADDLNNALKTAIGQ